MASSANGISSVRRRGATRSAGSVRWTPRVSGGRRRSNPGATAARPASAGRRSPRRPSGPGPSVGPSRPLRLDVVRPIRSQLLRSGRPDRPRRVPFWARTRGRGPRRASVRDRTTGRRPSGPGRSRRSGPCRQLRPTTRSRPWPGSRRCGSRASRWPRPSLGIVGRSHPGNPDQADEREHRHLHLRHHPPRRWSRRQPMGSCRSSALRRRRRRRNRSSPTLRPPADTPTRSHLHPTAPNRHHRSQIAPSLPRSRRRPPARRLRRRGPIPSAPPSPRHSSPPSHTRPPPHQNPTPSTPPRTPSPPPSKPRSRQWPMEREPWPTRTTAPNRPTPRPTRSPTTGVSGSRPSSGVDARRATAVRQPGGDGAQPKCRNWSRPGPVETRVIGTPTCSSMSARYRLAASGR